MTDEKNPIGIKAIDHLEFTTDTLHSPTTSLFHTLGFQRTSVNEATRSELYEQTQVRFLVTANPDENAHSRQYFKKHGEGVSKISFAVQNAEKAIETAVDRGASMVQDLKTEDGETGPVKTASIKGFGDVINEFVERPKDSFRPGYSQMASDPKASPLKQRINRIDHLTNNVAAGEMEHWVDFYKRIYGFVETRYFDIKGAKTGLRSKVVQLENNSVIIPINEPDSPGGKSQIQEFLDRHNGAGVQHIALVSPDIMTTVAELREREIKFLDVPDTYYEAIPERPFEVEEDIEKLKKLKLLVDGDKEGYLLQIFSETYIGPLFFEYIQRKKHWGFGEGNFQALFDAIERDQMKRGYLK